MRGHGSRYDESTHENARPDPELSDFAKDLLASSVRTDNVGTLERIPATADRPRRLYFTDPTGVRWRVFDMSFGPPENDPGHAQHHAPPYPPAKSRLFVTADGRVKLFSFNDRQAHPLIKRPIVTPIALSRQFDFGGYPQMTAEEETDPRRDFRIAPESTWVPTAEHGIRKSTSTLNRWTAFDAD